MQDPHSNTDYRFKVTESGHAVSVRVLPDGRTIEATMTLRNPGRHLLEAVNERNYSDLGDEHARALSKGLAPMTEALEHLVALVKQELHRYHLSDKLIGNLSLEWSLDQQQWRPVPSQYSTTMRTYSLANITPSLAGNLQRLLAEGERPLVATSFLHESRNAPDNRYKWIYATVAAELAIKEILMRFKPDLKTILEELPSPPLRKLYGVVLDSAAGITLPKRDLNRLNDGAEKRNKLVHTPNRVHLSDADVDDYINFVEQKIRWLLTQCREMERSRQPQKTERT